MSSNPSCISNTSVDVILFQTKTCFCCQGSIKRITSRSMNKTFRLTRTSRSIQNKQIIFRVHPFARAIWTLRSNEFVHLNISIIIPKIGCYQVFASSFPNKDLLNYIFTFILTYSLVCYFLKWNNFTSTQASISSKNPFGVRCRDTICKRIRRKPSKDNAMNCPDSCTCQHNHGNFWNHWHINSDNIALFYTRSLHSICNLTDFS
mmetsp:Transcript_6492/g.8543  ORF Transcript_6492/g.8543 Transcript_6492/m.8543 type:complete len:205 (-) Transcript_6492:830-1444(-)